jgi:UDP-glucose:(heptosyl)LPS alpha-1,3-glucosyltransferase
VRIGLVILHADPARGGAERYTVDLAAALTKRGHHVSLLASSFSDPITGVSEVTIAATGATRLGKYRRFLNHLDEHLTATKYDIVHAMLPVRRCDLYHPHAGIAAEALTKGNVWFNPRRRAMADVEHQLLMDERGPVVLCLSEYIKRFVTKHYPLPVERMQTLFNAVDLERFVPAPKNPQRERSCMAGPYFEVRSDDVLALMIAQDFERKGLAPAIEALARVDEDRLKLVVVGGDEAIRYSSLATNLGVYLHMRFTGRIADPRPFYSAADFFVLPTKHDPCSLVVLEALAMGLPVISTKFNGACEIMTDGVHGYVLDDPNDLDALAGAMRKMMDPARRDAMSKACLELRPRLSYEHHLDQLEAIYSKVNASRTG